VPAAAPIFSYGYMLRGNVQAALENQLASVEDSKAANLNPMDPLVAKTFWCVVRAKQAARRETVVGTGA
jgi:hypothetical protein